jgi:hypothetical protein
LPSRQRRVIGAANWLYSSGSVARVIKLTFAFTGRAIDTAFLINTHADYPIEKMTIACGELGHHIKDFCRSHQVDLVICGGEDSHVP